MRLQLWTVLSVVGCMGMVPAARGAVLFSTMTPDSDLTFTANFLSSPAANFYEDTTLTPLGGGVQGKGWGGIGYILKPAAGTLRQISAPFNVANPDGFRMEVYLVQTPVTNDGTASKNLTSQLTFLDSAVTTDIGAGKQWLNWDFTGDGTTIDFDGTSSYLFLPTVMKVHDAGADQLYWWMGRTSGGTSGTYLAEKNTAPVNTDLANGVADHMTGPFVSATPGIYISDTVTFGGVPEPGTLGMLAIGGLGILRRRRKA